MTRSRLIFLDIDGVLAHFGSRERLDPRAISELNGLVEWSRADLVLTSSWRDTFGIHVTERRLRDAGLRATLAAAVPCLPAGTRSDEIDVFLAARTIPTRFVILDDVALAEHLMPSTVVVDDFVGLTACDVVAAARILLLPGVSW